MKAFGVVLRVALVLGIVIDAGAGLVGLFAPQAVPAITDVPIGNAAFVQLVGGEFIVAALIYVLVLRDPAQYRALLWLCALDQAFAVVVPAVLTATGALPASPKIVAPIFLQALLVVVFVAGALRPGTKRSATPFMQ